MAAIFSGDPAILRVEDVSGDCECCKHKVTRERAGLRCSSGPRVRQEGGVRCMSMVHTVSCRGMLTGTMRQYPATTAMAGQLARVGWLCLFKSAGTKFCNRAWPGIHVE